MAKKYKNFQRQGISLLELILAILILTVTFISSYKTILKPIYAWQDKSITSSITSFLNKIRVQALILNKTIEIKINNNSLEAFISDKNTEKFNKSKIIDKLDLSNYLSNYLPIEYKVTYKSFTNNTNIIFTGANNTNYLNGHLDIINKSSNKSYIININKSGRIKNKNFTWEIILVD